jgi:hypothetical protein
MFPTKFLFTTSFGQAASEEKIQELPMTAMFANGSELNEESLSRTYQRCFLPSLDPFGKAASEEKIF